MMEDTFEGLEDDDLDEQADKEVDKVLFEITDGESLIMKHGIVTFIKLYRVL